MPIRGHSRRAGRRRDGRLRHRVPRRRPDRRRARRAVGRSGGASTCPSDVGLTAPEMVEAAERRRPRRAVRRRVEPPRGAARPAARRGRARQRVPLRVHQDIVLTSQMLVDGDDVILLPAATRYEQEGGGTSTTTERQIAFSPQVAEPARRGPQRVADLRRPRRRECGPTSPPASTGTTTAALRAEIGELVPMYAGIEDLEQVGDAVQYGGRHLCAGGRFPTPSGTGRFSVVDRRADRARTRRVVRVDAPRQAVQLDDAGGDRPADRAPAATRSTSTSTTPACSASPTATRSR